jgi:Tfp pilus assembly protein PilN
MSVRVNLLPAATKARGKASAQRNGLLAAFAVLLVLLGGVWWWADSQVRAAEDQLASERSRTASLRSEEAELVAFRDLADRRDQSEATISFSMQDEVSLAAIMQDLAAVMPTDTQLESVAVSIPLPADPTSVSIGSLSVTGKTLTSHAPGVERVLIQLDKIVTFDQLYLNSSSLDDAEGRVASFSLDGQVRREARTERYANGLPEVLR